MSNSPVNHQYLPVRGVNHVSTAYLLWAAGLVGLPGLHRIYNGKKWSGLLWLCTLGLFGIGQFIDLFFIQEMVEDHNQRSLARSGAAFNGGYPGQTIMAETVIRPPTKDEVMVKLVKAAAARGGRLSVTQAVMDTNIGFAEAEKVLGEMVKSGYVEIDNDPHSGIVVYDFRELSISS